MPEPIEKTRIPVTFYVYVDESNIETVMPTHQQAKAELAQNERDIADQTDLLQLVTTDEARMQVHARLSLLKRINAEYKKLIADILPNAQVHEYVLLRPTQGQLLAIQKQPGVRVVKEDGTFTTNREAYMNALLAVSVEDRTPAQVSNLSPDIFPRLFEKLEKAMFPLVADIPLWG